MLSLIHIFFGLNNGMIPIVAYNYGAKSKKRIMATVRMSIYIAVGIMLIGLVAVSYTHLGIHIEHREHGQDQEADHADRRRVSPVVELERVLVDKIHHDGGRVGRSSLGLSLIHI